MTKYKHSYDSDYGIVRGLFVEKLMQLYLSIPKNKTGKLKIKSTQYVTFTMAENAFNKFLESSKLLGLKANEVLR